MGVSVQSGKVCGVWLRNGENKQQKREAERESVCVYVEGRRGSKLGMVMKSGRDVQKSAEKEVRV
jgi:hypothetical protein